jgi:hypothetical protein
LIVSKNTHWDEAPPQKALRDISEEKRLTKVPEKSSGGAQSGK